MKYGISWFFTLILSAGVLQSPANATCTLPYQLTNGTTADASQVMANFNSLIGCMGSPTTGGFLNKFRNGTMDIWQRGTAVSNTSSGNYGPDGWKIYFNGSGSVTANQSPSTNFGAYPVRNFLAVTGATGNSDIKIGQRIESYIAAPLAGQTVTVQFLFYQTSGSSVTPKVSTCYASSTDNFGTCTSDLAASSVTSCANGTVCQEAYSFTASANALNGYEVDIDCNSGFTSSQNCAIGVADIRVTPGVATGPNSTPPPPELRPIATELLLCQRYFYSTYGNGVAPGTATRNGLVTAYAGASGTALSAETISFPVQMRAAPTLSYWDAAGTQSVASYYFNGSWTNGGSYGTFALTTGVSGFVTYPGSTFGAGSASFHYTASAEL